MIAFSEQQLLRWVSDPELRRWLSDIVGLRPMIDASYSMPDSSIDTVALQAIRRRDFAAPVFETSRTRGTDERVAAVTERIRVDRSQPRGGRTAWVDLRIDLLVRATITSTPRRPAGLDITDLVATIGTVGTFEDLRSRLSNVLGATAADALLKRFAITDVETFLAQPTLLVQFLAAAESGQEVKDLLLPLDVCVLLHDDVAVRESLRTAKLCRAILEHENDHAARVGDVEVVMPYVFVAVFPEAGVTDELIPGRSATETKAAVSDLFRAERMIACFV